MWSLKRLSVSDVSSGLAVERAASPSRRPPRHYRKNHRWSVGAEWSEEAYEPTLQPEWGLYIATCAAGMVPGCYQSTCAIAESWRCNTATASPHASAASSSASLADTWPVNLPRISTWVLHRRPDQFWGACALLGRGAGGWSVYIDICGRRGARGGAPLPHLRDRRAPRGSVAAMLPRALMLLALRSTALGNTSAGAVSGRTSVHIDTGAVGPEFHGLGGCSAGTGPRLLVDYPEPARSTLLDFLFLRE
jgi:hypothetical protein